MKSKAVSIRADLDALPRERYGAIARARPRFGQHLPMGSCAAMPFGNIAWEDLLGRSPQAYNGTGWMRARLPAPKQHIALDDSRAYPDLEAETLVSRRST